MKKTNLILFYACLFSFQTALAQVKVYEKGQQNVQGNSNKSSGVWKFKIDPYEAALAGTAKLYGERSFGEIFALEFGAGITYNSFMNSLMLKPNQSSYSDNDIFFGSIKSFTPSYASNSYSIISEKEAKIGYSFSLMPKIYFDEDPLDGFFLGILLDYKSYGYDFLYKNSKLPYNFSKFNTFVIFGTTREFGNNFFVESLMGFGPNFVNDQRYITYTNNTSGNTEVGRANMSSVRFGFYAGLRLGVYFE